MIIYRRISIQDPEYEQEKDLRNRVLRVPLGLVLSENDLRDEDKQTHLIAVNSEGRVVGCALVAFSGNTARIRQMAIEGSYQGRGIGTELLKRAESTARARLVFKVTLHARVSARGFYERLGYTAVSLVFSEVTIRHVAMEKELT